MIWPTKSSTCSMPGVWNALAHNEGAAVIFHSPRACAHIARQMNLYSQFQSAARRLLRENEIKAGLFVSDLTEQHAVFGGGTQLRSCIDALVEKHRPQYVVIANSCVAGVIGEDTRAVARDAGAYWNIPVMAVDGHGFLDGDYYSGFYQAGQLLINHLMKKQEQQPGTVTLIGDHGGPDSSAVRELKQLLQGFKLRVHAVFPAYATVQDIALVSASQLTVIMGGSERSYPWLKKLAESLQQKFAIPYVNCDYPVGWQATGQWLTAVGAAAGQPGLALEVQQQQALRLSKNIAAAHTCMQGKTVTLCLGRPPGLLSPEWLVELVQEAGMIIKQVILLDSLTAEGKAILWQRLAAAGVTCPVEEAEGKLRENRVDLVITTHELPEEQVRQLVLPYLPSPGVAGMSELLEQAARLLGRYGRRGGIIYG